MANQTNARALADQWLDAEVARVRAEGMAAAESIPSAIDYARVGDSVDIVVSVVVDGIEYADTVRVGEVIAAWTRGDSPHPSVK